MAQDLTTSSPVRLPVVDVREPASLLLLPPWLGEKIGAVSDLGAGRTEVDPKTGAIVRRVATIPASKMPTGPQRLAIAQRIEELHAASRPGPLQKTLQYIGQLVAEHAPARLDEDTAAVKIDAYEDAVGDLPAWAIREAIRRWRRGEVSGATADDLKFAPKPAKLRDIARGIAAVATGQAIRLQRILDAEPAEELTDAQRAEMQRRLAVETAAAVAKATDPAAEAASYSHSISEEYRAALDDLKRREERRLAEEEKA